MSACLLVSRLGLIDYQEAWDLQRHLADARRQDHIPDVLLLLEHPHTFTVGRRGRREHVLVPPSRLRRRGIGILDVDRGGDVTYHGPGQLVGYPIVKLPGDRQDRVRYLRDLEQALLAAVRSLRVDAGLQDGLSGVWVDDDKVCALGAKIDAYGVTTHGFALNVNVDLSYFRLIVPCGLHDKGVTSLHEVLGRHVSMRRVEQAVVMEIAGVFGLRTRGVGRQRLERLMGPSPVVD
ncbi:MAG: lipoyl(octanoyl) transferase LipB [Chloroflexota bacterium]